MKKAQVTVWLGASLPVGLRAAGFAAVLSVLSQTPAAAQTTFTPGEESPEQFVDAPGREQAFYACTACHNFKLVAAQAMSREGWDDTIGFMISRHNMPPLDPAERAQVLDYLATAYPPRAPSGRGGWQNPFAPK